MAWIFSMWVEAETEPENKAIREYFDGRKISANRKEYEISAYGSGMITVDGISMRGINSQSDADEMTSIGFEFYKLLKDAPTYRYALTGVEVDGFTYIEELTEDPEYYLAFKGFVIQKELYERVQGKKKMQPFSQEYLWTPYEGEIWK